MEICEFEACETVASYILNDGERQCVMCSECTSVTLSLYETMGIPCTATKILERADASLRMR